ncbi:MAG: LLM class flavin-dependent oxidoreductase, partial [Gammaproteobacteria bacterium]
PQDTCFAYGQNPSMLRQRYFEGIDFILQSWTRDEVFAFDGRFNKQRYVNVWPRPIQQPHPPVWIPGGGSVETWHYCAERDYVYCFLSYFGYKLAREQMHGYWAEIKRLGKDPNPYRAGFLQFVGVAETRAEAMKLYREPAEYFYGRCLYVDPRWVVPPGYMTEATIRARVESQMVLAAKVSAGGGPSVNQNATDFENIVENGYVLVGSPDEVAEKLREIAIDLGVGHLMLLLQFGNMGKQLTQYNTKLFAERVMPQLRDLFDDEWEDRWWVKPLQKTARAPAVAA